MKKTIFLFATITMLFTSCGNNSGNTGQSADATGTDSAVVEQPAVVEEFTTPDLTLVDVKGNVDTIENLNWATSATFDKEGNLLTYDSDAKVTKMKRDNDGQPVYFISSGHITVTWENNRPKTVETSINEMTQTDTYVYNADGLMEKRIRRYVDLMEDSEKTVTTTYTYDPADFDSHGNWLKRAAKADDGNSYVETRTISYHK